MKILVGLGNKSIKKMPIAANFIGYIPPIWKKNPSVGEYIEYQVLNPATMKMERQRIRLTTMT